MGLFQTALSSLEQINEKQMQQEHLKTPKSTRAGGNGKAKSPPEKKRLSSSLLFAPKDPGYHLASKPVIVIVIHTNHRSIRPHQ